MGQLYATKTITVPSGGTSGTTEIENYDVMGLDVPTLTSSTWKLQGSVDGTTYRDVYDGTGSQTLVWAASTGDRCVASRDLADLSGYKYIRVVCGTAQGAERVHTLYIKAPRRH